MLGADLTKGATAPETLDALSCPSERSAIIEEGYYCDPDAADRRALAEAGHPSWQNFSDGHRRRIAAALKELPPPRAHNGRRLIAETRRFLGSNWFPLALECGWTLDALLASMLLRRWSDLSSGA